MILPRPETYPAGRAARTDGERDGERALLTIAAFAVLGLATALLAVCATLLGVA